MIISYSNQPFAAISYDTTTYADLSSYMSEQGHTLNRVDPEQDLDPDYQYINLVTQDFDLREHISQNLYDENHVRFSYVHPTSVIANGTRIGKGVFVYPLCSTYTNSTIENDVIVHGQSFIAHSVHIKDGTIFAPCVSVSGTTTIGRFCFVGINATVIDKIEVCDHAYIGAGAVVINNITNPGKYVGVPAKQI
jgi:UDP-3-O-[3-hydroxymyristoyl] glucosamine N-acyltransferase